MNPVRWIGVDWGTTNLRAFAVDATGRPVDEKSSDRGMAKLRVHEFEPALLDLIAPWLSHYKQIPVYACGMVGAQQGWCEARYRNVPCPPVAASGLTLVPTHDQRIRVHILPGLCQSSPADVMRGEETQIAALLARDPDYCGTICLPGTHSKWASVADGNVEGFTTFMTGELFDVLANRTILRHSVGGEAWDDKIFLGAALRAVNEPQGVAEELFGLRAASLLSDTPRETLRSRLSGMLIGQELGLTKRYWQARSVTLIGSHATVPLYRQVLQVLECEVETLDARDAALAGLALVATTSAGCVDHSERITILRRVEPS